MAHYAIGHSIYYKLNKNDLKEPSTKFVSVSKTNIQRYWRPFWDLSQVFQEQKAAWKTKIFLL